MLKSLAALTLALTMRVPLRFSPLSLVLKPKFTFCTSFDHPIIQKLLKVSESRLDQSLVQMTKLNDVNKQTAIRIILQRIQANTFSPRVLLHEKFIIHLKKFPQLYIRALLTRIEQQYKELSKFMKTKKQEGKKVAVKDINNCFTIIFEYLKKIPRNQVAVLEIEASKKFAEYHQMYLLQLIDHKLSNNVLQKSFDFYKNALNKIVNYLEVEQAKVVQKGDEVLAEEDFKKVKEEDEDAIQKIENSIGYKRFTYAEEYCEVLYRLMEVHNYLTDPRIKQNQKPKQKIVLAFQYHAGLFTLIPLFKKAVSLYDKIQSKLDCKYYYKVKKSLLELEHHERMHLCKQDTAKIQKEIQLFESKMDEFTVELAANLIAMPYIEDTLQIQQSHCLLLLSLKVNKLSRQHLDLEQFQAKLLKEVNDILKLILDEDVRKLISLLLLDLIFKNILENYPEIPGIQAGRQNDHFHESIEQISL